MTTLDISTRVFCPVDDEMNVVPKHRYAKLDTGQVVALSIPFAVIGGQCWAFMTGSVVIIRIYSLDYLFGLPGSFAGYV
jgi:hypothetical protein